MSNSTFEKLLQIFKDTIDDDIDFNAINLETKIFQDLNLDSISTIYLVLSIQEQFNIKLDNENIKGIVTVGDLVKYIDEKSR
jgi:acyl carrier protein